MTKPGHSLSIWRAAALVMVLASLISCAPNVDSTICPPAFEYSATEKKSAGVELLALCPIAKKPSEIPKTCPKLVVPWMVDRHLSQQKDLERCADG